jgi:hypothetical protein
MSSSIQPGRIVKIHSLQSAAGKQLNGKRAVVLRFVLEDDRFEVILDDSDNPNKASKSIRPANLKVVIDYPCPTRMTAAIIVESSRLHVPVIP